MRSRLQYIVPIVYLLIIAFCIWQSISRPIEGFDWFGVCMVLTLPWSIVTYLLILGALHIVGDNGIFVAQGISALLNAVLLFLIF